jgi:hypothetical protein
MPFGKYRGRPLSGVPFDYLVWVLENVSSLNPWLRRGITAELDRRVAAEEEYKPAPAPPPPPGGLVDIASVVRTWYRELSMKYHPDRGGSHEAMTALNDAHERLKVLAGIS